MPRKKKSARDEMREIEEGREDDRRAAEAAERDRAEGKAPSTQAGEFVKEEIRHVREGKHGARSTKQAIAIGLSKARRAGVPLPPPKPGTVSEETRRQTEREAEKGRRGTRRPPSLSRSKAIHEALEREPHAAASHEALSRQARRAARRRGPAARRAAAKKAARTRRRT